MKFSATDPAKSFTLKVQAPGNDLGSAALKITNLLLYAAGILAVVFVLVGAFQYVISGGNPDATKKAKDTILYALIGLVVTAAAYAIVNFVLGGLK